MGWSQPSEDPYGHNTKAFLWDPAHGMKDLNTLVMGGGFGWDLQVANDIGNDGRIVGVGTLQGEKRGFVLIPFTFSKLPPFSPASVAGGASSLGSITMSEAAPGDVTIQLSSSSPYASVPATVTVPRGRSSVGFSITTRPVRATVEAVITATFDEQSTTGTLWVVP